MKKSNLLIFLLLPLFCLAQSTLKLKGKVSNETAGLEWADVSVFNSEGKIIDGTTTKQDGSFEINLKKGTYKITISLLGYSEYEKEISIEKDTDLGIIILKETTTNLGEVVIQTKKKTVEQKIDRVVYNVENNISVTGGDALTAINTAPGVVVQNNVINILGKGASRVMIDGRMIELSGEELNSYLKSISANDIKSIEVIANPPAKYEANGTGGIINIILKKGIRDSWKNATTISYDQNKYGIYTLRNSFFYNKNKFRFAFSGNGRIGNTNNTEDLDIYYPTGLWELRDVSKQKENSISGRFSLDYDVSDKTTIGFQYLNESYNPDMNSNTVISIFNNSNSIDSVLINKGFNNKYSGSQTYNTHLISKLDSIGRKVSVDVDYFTYDSKFDKNFTAKSYLPDGTYQNTNQAARNNSNQNIDNFSLKADFEYPMKAVNLSYGGKVSFVKSNSDVFYYNTISGSEVLDPNQSNVFEYKENNQAVYLNGNKKINDKISVQLGFRLENTQTNGYSATLDQEVKNDYLKLFPSLYLDYQLNDNHGFNFTYGKRINRPGFGLLNPFRSYINSNSYSEGNPFLRPSFSNNFDFTYSFKKNLRTNIFFNKNTNGYGVVFTSNPEINTQIVTRENYFDESSFGIGESYSAEVTNWFETQTSVYLLGSKTSFISNINAVPSNSAQVYFTTENSFSLSETTKLQLEYFYSSPFKKGLYEIGYMAGLNIAIRQSFLKNNLQLTFLVNDIFNTSYLKDYKSIVNGVVQVYSQNESNRFVRLSATYNFGNKKIKVQERDFGNKEEKKRTGK
ncbi:TonB-dependent receptor domain-containing protein [Flavobacterium johnsoniae]|uniref:TonB-dependent receptor n=1 Tax=Flavobacterium johnsoniae (strain ATCC 17061 / DSM 2064 / JCM 8514 / BCRC 14874 / CCUG 350202 / NBRC 14942 / NCIMB 11054 / UW101) TaxID=376686 RepID=A5FGZ7_FLAJ1|nr:TonB-dependent receptor [Flavobacterium johnsoniae]ABQ05519.1 TonB-dependent receptor [Flavobacterium johnsoniae UW101]OXE96752.1 TonB-dependent receptor [Flavobacterium johnsoniae UW101]WQG82679.1 TonB-dependent receptor [Flavobacterium johnsoniae UW101]SHL54898.1 Outer membrane receptor proteins, mostly Fe transport [Flavobacterium johnsoniae]